MLRLYSSNWSVHFGVRTAIPKFDDFNLRGTSAATAFQGGNNYAGSIDSTNTTSDERSLVFEFAGRFESIYTATGWAKNTGTVRRFLSVGTRPKDEIRHVERPSRLGGRSDRLLCTDGIKLLSNTVLSNTVLSDTVLSDTVLSNLMLSERLRNGELSVVGNCSSVRGDQVKDVQTS
jgi:hypothetical protein